VVGIYSQKEKQALGPYCALGASSKLACRVVREGGKKGS